jgi:hypothetical protein
LLLDWDRGCCHLLAADLNRTGMEASAAAVWRPEEELSAATAEALGKKLREFLKANNLPAAPVLACIGRDRVVLKEIAYPQVKPQEEAALVRFQASKDLADAADDVVLDYAVLTEPGSEGERRALAVILRRDILTGLQQLCRAAGLKLQGLVPRPFGMAGCLELARSRVDSLPRPESSQEIVAALLIGQRWAELDILQGSKLIFSRSLGIGASLPAEVRRNLAVLATQTQGNGQRLTARALYVIPNGTAAVSLRSLHDTLGLPVYDLDFLSAKEKALLPAEHRSALAAGMGLLQAWSQKVPVDLANAKQPVTVVDQGRRRKLVLLAGAAVLLIAAWVCGQTVLAAKRSEIADLESNKVEIDENFKRFEQDKTDLDAMKDWDRGAIPWIDELYDLAARFPQENGVYLTKLQIEQIPRRDAKDKNKEFAARMTLHGICPTTKLHLLDRFVDSLRDAFHVVGAPPTRREGNNEKFTLRLEIARQPASSYKTKLYILNPVLAAGIPRSSLRLEVPKKKAPPPPGAKAPEAKPPEVKGPPPGQAEEKPPPDRRPQFQFKQKKKRGDF